MEGHQAGAAWQGAGRVVPPTPQAPSGALLGWNRSAKPWGSGLGNFQLPHWGKSYH